MASSRPIAAGEDYTPDDINNLRSDVLDPVGGHSHDGTDGRKIPFSNLDVTTGTAGSAPPSGGSKSYNDIANHVSQGQGAHGLHTSVYVAGGAASGTLIQAGTDLLSGSSKLINFPIAFQTGTKPIVVATYGESRTDIGNPSEASDIFVDYAFTDHTRTRIHTSDPGQWGDKRFNWMALGVKNA